MSGSSRSVSGFSEPPVSFRDKFAVSPQFKALFQEGMSLVDQTAAYLDSQGRLDSRELKPPVAQVYATESMRLTTRLLQVASWLLLRRAVTNGELSEDQVRHHKKRVPLSPPAGLVYPEGFDQLPERLKELITSSLKLHDRIARLDSLGSESALAFAENGSPVQTHITRLRLAYSS
jgi:regulator of CtrA degradation